jgi:putative spermidine/putrescine transport system substrate-binding protein
MRFHPQLCPRRVKVLAGTASAVAALLALAACGSSGTSSGGTSSSGTGSSQIEHTLVFMGPSGAQQATFTAILQPLLTKYHVTLKYEVATSEVGYAQILAGERRHSPGVDILNGNDKIIAIGRSAGVWAPLNETSILATAKLDTTWAFPPAIMGTPPVGVRLFVVPEGIIYNKKVFAEHGWAPPTSWTDLLNKKYASCVVPLTPGSGLNYLEMVNKDLTGNYLDFGPTLAGFKAIAKTVPSFAATNADANQLVAQGTGCIAPSEQASALAAAAGGAPVGFVFPKEGAPLFGGTLSIPVNAPDPHIAALAVQELLSASSADELLKKTGLPSTNEDESPGTGAQAAVPTVSQFGTSNFVDVPLLPESTLNNWIQEWNTMSGG